MSLKKTLFFLAISASAFFALLAPALAQSPSQEPSPGPAELGDVKGAVVTLYYYDQATGGKGGIVPLPDGQNPQAVEWDSTKAAPGTYTFTRVPFGTYYVEAVHKGNAWFAIVTVGEGTATANVAIPPNATAWGQVSPTPSPTSPPAGTPSPTPAMSPTATPSPGMTTASAIIGLTLVALYVVYQKK